MGSQAQGQVPCSSKAGPNLLVRLAELQIAGRLSGAPFTAVPPSCQTPVETLLDGEGQLRNVVLLGFSRDGGHLISYSTQPVAAADGVEGYSLQLWSYQQGQRCRRLWSVPLFRTQAYLDSLQDEDDFLGAADDMLITIAEAPDSSLLVVHGRSADPTDAASRDHQLPNFLTIIPGPRHAGAAQLQAVHLAYMSSFPHAPFNPFHFLMPLDASPGDPSSSSSTPAGGSSDGATLAVALYSGSGVRYLHAAAARLPAVQAVPVAQQAEQQGLPGEDEYDSAASRFSTPEPTASAGASPALAPAGQRAPAQPPASPSTWQHAQQHHRGGSTSPAPSPSPHSSPWHRQSRVRRLPQLQRQERSPAAVDSSGECDLDVRVTVTPCAHASGGGSTGSGCSGGWAWWQQQQQQQQHSLVASGSSRALAAVSLWFPPQQLDLEACLFAALRHQGLPAASLADYAAAPVQGCTWQQQDGLLVLALLRLLRQPAAEHSRPPAGSEAQQQQQQQRQGSQQPCSAPAYCSACVLLHAAAEDGSARLVEWLESPYPWHDDLSAFLVQQTAFAGLAFEKAPAFFAEFLARRYGSGPPPRSRLPGVLTNRSVLQSGASLHHIVHPWLPQAILGYGGAS